MFKQKHLPTQVATPTTTHLPYDHPVEFELDKQTLTKLTESAGQPPVPEDTIPRLLADLREATRNQSFTEADKPVLLQIIERLRQIYDPNSPIYQKTS